MIKPSGGSGSKIQLCAFAAENIGATVFAISNGRCYSDTNALETYRQHGPKSNCKNGMGQDMHTIQVYHLISGISTIT